MPMAVIMYRSTSYDSMTNAFSVILGVLEQADAAAQ